MTERYVHLGAVLSDLSKKITALEQLRSVQPTLANQIKYNKLQTERNLVHTRRVNIRSTLHREGSRYTTAMLLFTEASYLACEKLSVSTDGTKESLAKAITSMPDDVNLYLRAVTVAQTISLSPKQLVRVDPYNTSKSSHVGCPVTPAGNIKRKHGQYDIVSCLACGESVNSHTNAALQLMQRCTDYLTQLSSIPIPSTLFSFPASSYSTSSVL
jgi:hypothetical protein